MAKKKSTNKIYLFAGAILLGVGGYFGYKYLKKKKAEAEAAKIAAADALTTLTAPSMVSSGSMPSSAPAVISNPFLTKAELLAFQKWVINTKGDKTILGKGGSTGFGDDGSWGSKTSSAWIKYGAEYVVSKGTGSSITTTSKDIDLIIRYAGGSKAEKSYLNQTSPDYVKQWASGIRKRLNSGGAQGSTFIFANQLYETFSGTKVFNSVPLGKIATPKENCFAFTKPDRYSGSTPVSSWETLGSVKAIVWNNDQKLLFFYFPDNSLTWKWISSNSVTLK